MEVPGISNAGGSYAPSPAYGSFGALQASSSAVIEMPAQGAEGMSLTVASQVNMVFGQMSQGGQVNDQMIKALIMLLLVQMMMNGGMDEKTGETLRGLADAFQGGGQSEMSMVAMQASSMIQMDFGGEMPVMALESSAGASLDIMA